MDILVGKWANIFVHNIQPQRDCLGTTAIQLQHPPSFGGGSPPSRSWVRRAFAHALSPLAWRRRSAKEKKRGGSEERPHGDGKGEAGAAAAIICLYLYTHYLCAASSAAVYVYYEIAAVLQSVPNTLRLVFWCITAGLKYKRLMVSGEESHRGEWHL